MLGDLAPMRQVHPNYCAERFAAIHLQPGLRGLPLGDDLVRYAPAWAVLGATVQRSRSVRRRAHRTKGRQGILAASGRPGPGNDTARGDWTFQGRDAAGLSQGRPSAEIHAIPEVV